MQTGGIGIARALNTGGIPVWIKVIELTQGGFALDKTDLAAGAILPAGTPMVYNEATRLAAPLRTAVAQANAASNAVNYKVLKGHNLKVGDYFATGSAGGAAYAITGIDTSNADYDTVTVGTTIGAATAGDLFFVSTATGASASALPAVNGLLYEDTIVEPSLSNGIYAGSTLTSGIVNSVGIVTRGTVYARRVPYSAAIAALAGLEHIIYSQSY